MSADSTTGSMTGCYGKEAYSGRVLADLLDLNPAHHRLSSDACQRYESTVLGERIRLGRQKPDDLVGRRGRTESQSLLG